MTDDIDELEALQAIYCQPGELCISHGGDGSRQVKVRLKSASDPADTESVCVEAELCLLLPSAYPSKAPAVSVCSSQLGRKDTAQVRTLLCERALDSLDQPMLMELITLAAEELHRLEEKKATQHPGGEDCRETCSSSPPGMKNDCDDRMVLLHLDHMRAKTQYVKLIKKWVAELTLTGRLVFCQRLIVIVLQGTALAIKEYIVRQRTCSVDVDSRGQPCKERMLSVVCDVGVNQHHFRFTDFETVELNTADDLREFCSKCCSRGLFLDHVQTLKHFPGR